MHCLSEWPQTCGYLVTIAFQYTLEYAIGRSKRTRKEWNWRGTYQLLLYSDVNLLGKKLNDMTEKIADSSRGLV
jgi:hypothetical protein